MSFFFFFFFKVVAVLLFWIVSLLLWGLLTFVFPGIIFPRLRLSKSKVVNSGFLKPLFKNVVGYHFL